MSEPLRLHRLALLGAKQLHDWEPRKGPNGDHGTLFETCHNRDCMLARAFAAEWPTAKNPTTTSEQWELERGRVRS